MQPIYDEDGQLLHSVPIRERIDRYIARVRRDHTLGSDEVASLATVIGGDVLVFKLDLPPWQEQYLTDTSPIPVRLAILAQPDSGFAQQPRPYLYFLHTPTSLGSHRGHYMSILPHAEASDNSLFHAQQPEGPDGQVQQGERQGNGYDGEREDQQGEGCQRDAHEAEGDDQQGNGYQGAEYEGEGDEQAFAYEGEGGDQHVQGYHADNEGEGDVPESEEYRGGEFEGGDHIQQSDGVLGCDADLAACDAELAELDRLT